jgi:[amino group carrier protein]-lysine/ornithine hydrolase
MLSIPSLSRKELKFSEWLIAHLASMGFESGLDRAGNVMAWHGKGSRQVALVGHLDTVPGLITVRREGDRLYGRGAVDAKGPLAAAITALTLLPADIGARFTLIACVDEEGGSRGARYATAYPAPDAMIILEPSGWDAVTLGYKGSLRLDYTLTQPMAHGAGPTPSAADRAVAFLRRLQDHAATDADAGPFSRLDVRILHMSAENDGMEDRAQLGVGLRLPPNCDIDALERAIQGWAEGADLVVKYTDPAVKADKNTGLVRAFVQAIREQGGTPRFKLKTGTSDMNILAPAWGCATLAYGPGDSRLDHTPDEAIDFSEFQRGVAVLTSALALLGR